MFLRIILWAVIIFFLARFVMKILSRLLKSDDDTGIPKRDRRSVRRREDYRDVRDAKYTDVNESDKDMPSDRKAS